MSQSNIVSTTAVNRRIVFEDQAMSSASVFSSIAMTVASSASVIWNISAISATENCLLKEVRTVHSDLTTGYSSSDIIDDSSTFSMESILHWHINGCVSHYCRLKILLLKHIRICAGITFEVTRMFNMRRYEPFRYDGTPHIRARGTRWYIS